MQRAIKENQEQNHDIAVYNSICRSFTDIQRTASYVITVVTRHTRDHKRKHQTLDDAVPNEIRIERVLNTYQIIVHRDDIRERADRPAAYQSHCRRDNHRAIAPLKMAKDSVKLDTSEMNVQEVLAELKRIIGEKVPL